MPAQGVRSDVSVCRPILRGRMHALVIAGGDPPAPIDAVLAAAPLVVPADSGVAHALALGLRIALVIGDLDSAAPEDVARAVAAGARVDRHPADKDATDL